MRGTTAHVQLSLQRRQAAAAFGQEVWAQVGRRADGQCLTTGSRFLGPVQSLHFTGLCLGAAGDQARVEGWTLSQRPGFVSYRGITGCV